MTSFAACTPERSTFHNFRAPTFLGRFSAGSVVYATFSPFLSQRARAASPPPTCRQLALSPDGTRLVLKNTDDGGKGAVTLGDLNGTPALDLQGSSTSASSSSSARNAPPHSVLGGHHSASRGAVSSYSSSSPYSSRVPLVRRRHVAFLLRSHGAPGGDGGLYTPTAAAVNAKKVSLC